MSSELPLLQELVKLIFPLEISEHFLISKVTSNAENIVIYLEEKDLIHHPLAGVIYDKNGFHDASEIPDFPLRDKKVTLSVKRRRWVERDSGKSVSNDYDLVATGTRHSKEFAAFLKGILGQIPDHGPLS